jgi:predicted ATPase
MLASKTADQLAQNPFDVANQLNRGAALMIDRDERAQLATINLRSGRKAKASAAYTTAHAYFSAGMALLDERDWNSQYELTFSLWLERAECEFPMASFDYAEQLIDELLRRGVTKLDQAAVYHLKVQVHEVKGEYPQAVASGLTCLKQFDINIPAKPTQEQVQAEYEAVWEKLNGRPIESLVNLQLMTDLEMQAAMRVLSVLCPAAYFVDSRLCCLEILLMVDDRGRRARVRLLRELSRAIFSSLCRWLSFRQARMRSCREVRIHRVPGEALSSNGKRQRLD